MLGNPTEDETKKAKKRPHRFDILQYLWLVGAAGMMVSFIDAALDLTGGYHYFIWVHMSEATTFPFFAHLPRSKGAELDYGFTVTFIMLLLNFSLRLILRGMLCIGALSMTDRELKRWLQYSYHVEFLSTSYVDPYSSTAIRESRSRIFWYVVRNAAVSVHGFALTLILVWAYWRKKCRDTVADRVESLIEEGKLAGSDGKQEANLYAAASNEREDKDKGEKDDAMLIAV